MGENTGYMHSSSGKHYDTKTDDNGNVYARSTEGVFGGGWESCGNEKAESRGDARRIANEHINSK